MEVEKKMTIDSHRVDSEERQKRWREDAKENCIQKKMNEEQYARELNEETYQFVDGAAIDERRRPMSWVEVQKKGEVIYFVAEAKAKIEEGRDRHS